MMATPIIDTDLVVCERTTICLTLEVFKRICSSIARNCSTNTLNIVKALSSFIRSQAGQDSREGDVSQADSETKIANQDRKRRPARVKPFANH